MGLTKLASPTLWTRSWVVTPASRPFLVRSCRLGYQGGQKGRQGWQERAVSCRFFHACSEFCRIVISAGFAYKRCLYRQLYRMGELEQSMVSLFPHLPH